jgi:hypothetical protein
VRNYRRVKLGQCLPPFCIAGLMPVAAASVLKTAAELALTWGQDRCGSGCQRLFHRIGTAGQLGRSLPAVEPAPLRQDTSLVSAKFGSSVLEPDLQQSSGARIVQRHVTVNCDFVLE